MTVTPPRHHGGVLSDRPYRVREPKVPECIVRHCKDQAEFGPEVARFCLGHWTDIVENAIWYEAQRKSRNWREEKAARLERHEREKSVYYVRRLRDGQIKIGFATSVTDRMLNLRDGHGELEVLATEPGARRKEMQRHEEFAHLRQQGEWFLPGSDLLAHIDAIDKGLLDVG